ncbi:PucR family transcriptional regulator [Nocardiopsis tropica]
MRDLAAQRTQTGARWLELVESTRRDLPLLVEAFVAEVTAIPAYGDGSVPGTELRKAASESIDLLLGVVAGRIPVSDLGSVPIELGRRRARAHVPLEDLAAADRLDFSVIWSDLLRRATSDDTAVLALHAGDLWSIVDEYARNVQHSYLDERAAMAASARDEQQSYLTELVQPGGPPQSRVGRIARALDLDPESVFRVVAIGTQHDRDAYRAVQTATHSGASMHLTRREDAVVIFWPTSSGALTDEVQLRLLDRIPGGIVDDVDGLGNVARGADAAEQVLAVLRDADRGLHDTRRVWHRLSRTHLDATRPFSETELAGLDLLSDTDRETVIGTVLAYLDTGSVSVTAAREFCHRNTVLNRLTRFRELTGLDVTLPRQSALAVVLLA